MSKSERFIVFVLGVVVGIMIIFLVIIINENQQNSTPDKEAASRQEKNLEVLKKAKEGDLVVCGSDFKDGDKMAVLVQRNTGETLSGRHFEKFSVVFGNGISYNTFQDCHVRVLKSKEASYSLIVGDIILGSP
ncbi:MAG: hypothetical protein AAB547_00975 [Patescibacteria group bacterium]|mgnify:FL=1